MIEFPNDMSLEEMKRYKTKIIYKPQSVEVKNHPKYKLSKEICKETKVIDLNESNKSKSIKRKSKKNHS